MAMWAFISYHQNNQLSILYHFKGNFENEMNKVANSTLGTKVAV